MACKLVAIYQKSLEENALDELSSQKIDGAITTASKYTAVFDFAKFENMQTSELPDPADVRSMV